MISFPSRLDAAARMLYGGAGLSLGTQMLSLALLFGWQAFLARKLGPEEYGIFAIAFTSLTLLVILTKMGLDGASTRIVASLPDASRRRLASPFLAFALAIPAIAGLLAALLATLLLVYGDLVPPSSMRSTLIAASWGLPFLGIVNVASGCLRGFRQMIASQAAEGILRPVLHAGAVAVWLMVVHPEQSLEASSVMWLLTLVRAVCGLSLLLAMRPAILESVSLSLAYSDCLSWLRLGWAFLLTEGAAIGMRQAPVLLVGAMVSAPAAGLYAVCFRAASVTGIGVMAVTRMAGPMISSSYAKPDHDELARTVRATAQAMALTTVPLAFVVTIWGREILAMFGPSFSSGHAVLILLCGSYVVNSLAGPTALSLSMTSYHARSSGIMLAAFCMQVLLTMAVIPVMGAVGAALAALIATAVWNALMFRAVKDRLALNSTMVGPLSFKS